LKTSNSTGRLAIILEKARKQPTNISISQAWANVLDIPKSDNAKVLEGIAELLKLSVEARKEVDNAGYLSAPIYKKPFVKVEKAFSNLNLNSGWSAVISHIDEGTVDMLGACSDFISKHSSTKEMSYKDLEKIKSQLDEVVSTIVKSNLPEDLKAFFIKNLEALRTSLFMFNIKGPEGINKEIQRIYGSLNLRCDYISEELKKADDKEEESSWKGVIGKVHGLLVQANSITTEYQKLDNFTGGAISSIIN